MIEFLWNWISSPQMQLLGIVALAMVLGGIVGFEREYADKPAGLRTHMLVSGAAALLVSLSAPIVQAGGLTPARISADPIRIIEAVVTGISFLGAGTILQRREMAAVEGLTTAASLLLVAAIGISVALRQWTLAGGTTVLTVIVLYVVKRWEIVQK